MGNIPAFIRDRLMAWFDESKGTNSEAGEGWSENIPKRDYGECNLILSQVMGNTHLPVIDLDYDCALVPSRTNGHYHLYMNKQVEWSKFLKVLEAMQDAGLVQKGYVDASRHRGYSAVRKPKEASNG